MDKKGVVKKIWTIALNVLLYAFLLIALFSVIMAVVSKKDVDGAAEIFGHQLRFVQSDSMGECEETDVSGYKIKSIPVKSLIFVQVKPEKESELNSWYKDLRKGDVLTFRYKYTRQETITHRIVEIDKYVPEGGVTDGSVDYGYKIELKGDNKASENSETLSQVIYTKPEFSPDPNEEQFNYVIGKVVGQSEMLGVLIYAVRNPIGIILIVIVPSLIVIAIEIVRIVRVCGAEKKIQAETEKQQQQERLNAQESELEELKRQLAALQKAQAPPQETGEETKPAESDSGSETKTTVDTSETAIENNNTQGEVKQP